MCGPKVAILGCPRPPMRARSRSTTTRIADRKSATPRHHPGLGAERPAVGTPARCTGAALGAGLVRQLVGEVADQARTHGAGARLLVPLRVLLLRQLT